MSPRRHPGLRTPAEERYHVAMRELGRFTVDDLVRRMKVGRTSVNARLAQAREEGLIRVCGGERITWEWRGETAAKAG